MSRNMLALGTVLGVVGILMLGFVDYRIAIGVFFFVWGNNLQNGLRS
jgi:hypothetical protein